MIQCPRCEEKLPEAAGYCGACGYAIAPFGRDSGGQGLARSGHLFSGGEGEDRLRASSSVMAGVGGVRSGPPGWAIVLTLANALVFGGSVTLFLMGAHRAGTLVLPAGTMAVPAYGNVTYAAAPPPAAPAPLAAPPRAPEAPVVDAGAPAPSPAPVAVSPEPVSRPARATAPGPAKARKGARAAIAVAAAAAEKAEKPAPAARKAKIAIKKGKGKGKAVAAAVEAPAADAPAEGSTEAVTQAPAPVLPTGPTAGAPKPLAPPQQPDSAPAAAASESAPASTASVAPRGIDSEGIRLVIRRYLPQMRACYERELKNESDLKGTVEVRFTIDPDGKVTQAEHVGGTLQSAPVGSCVTSRVRRWKFPRPAAGRVDLIYPFSFNPY